MDGTQFWCFLWFPANFLLCVIYVLNYNSAFARFLLDKLFSMYFLAEVSLKISRKVLKKSSGKIFAMQCFDYERTDFIFKFNFFKIKFEVALDIKNSFFKYYFRPLFEARDNARWKFLSISIRFWVNSYHVVLFTIFFWHFGKNCQWK